MSFRELFDEARADAGDSTPIVCCSLSDEQMDQSNEYIMMREAGGFCAWSEARVYFPLCYDGGLWVGSAPRNPCDEKTAPMGGGGW